MNTKLGKTLYVGCVAVFLASLGCWAVLAHQDSGSMKTSQDKMSGSKMGGGMMDAKFAKDAAQGGMAEIKMGQLAQDKGTNDAVKSFGQRMVADHTKAGDQLKDAAAKENITLPSDLNAKDQATYDRLSKLSGAGFDKAYARDMVTDHKKDVADFQKEANSGKSDSIKGFASQTLPTLQEHLTQAKEMMKTVSSSGSGKSGMSGSGQGKSRR